MHALEDRRLLAGVANYGHRPSGLAKRAKPALYRRGAIMLAIVLVCCGQSCALHPTVAKTPLSKA